MPKLSIYHSKNGYTGILKANNSLSIRDKEGIEVYHVDKAPMSDRRYICLMNQVDGFPKHLESLREVAT